MHRFLSSLFHFCTCAVLVASLRGETVVSLIGPSGSVHAGETVTVEWVALNTGTTSASITAPRTLSGRLVRDEAAHPVRLRLQQASPETVPPGGFIRKSYTLEVPPDASGWWVLELESNGGAPLRAGLEVQTVAPMLAETSPTTMAPRGASGSSRITSLADPEPAASAIVRTFAGRIAPHEPIYFIYGPDDPAAKFQFSFKYRVLTLDDPPTGYWPDSLHFAFTQRSLWDLRGESSPFYDTSYIPELILEALAPERAPLGGWLSFLGYQLGYRHESNGRDGEISRSLNQAFLRPVFAIGHLDGWHLLIAPEFYTYVGDLDNNPDIKDYRGHAALRAMFGKNDGPSVAVAAWAGRDFDHPTYQIDLTVPIRTRLLDFQTYFLIQYYNGYGESLLSYQEESDVWRAGISLVR